MAFGVANDFAIQMDTAALVGDRSEWDRKVRFDLAKELETNFPGPAFTLLGVQRMLSIKGYREVANWMKQEVGDKQGDEALRACARVMRAYIMSRPGLAAATWLTPTSRDKEWSAAAAEAGLILRKAFAESGIEGNAAQHGIHWLRGLVRGYVVHEMAGSFVKPVDLEEGFELGVSIFLRGLSVLRENADQNRIGGLAMEPATPPLTPHP